MLFFFFMLVAGSAIPMWGLNYVPAYEGSTGNYTCT